MRTGNPSGSPVFHRPEQLDGRGIGYIDACLLAAATLGSAKLWTRDKRLAALAEELVCGHPQKANL